MSQEHVKMLTDALDNNYEKVLDFVYEYDEVNKGIDALALVNEKVIDLFLDETKKPYGAINMNNHVETVPIESQMFEDWVGQHLLSIPERL